MNALSLTLGRPGGACAAFALGLLLTGCGGGSSSTIASKTTVATPRTPASAAAVSPRLLILTPRRGAHTDQSLAVRVRLSGATPTMRHLFRYVLDGRIARLGSARLTFHELALGRHRLLVMLGDDRSVRASSFFFVRAPAPVAAPEPAPITTATAQTPETTPAPAPAPSQTTTRSATSAPAPTPAPPSTGGIPQGNGGDRDGDNNGGPSDGDGNF
ncbi:MAG TPA: hypothetical protein VNJ51_07560 [Candidatus Dormibacteraeota bacterium]|nr:hypothetical protein [Candidatus Dormibacteraeota bacterium]